MFIKCSSAILNGNNVSRIVIDHDTTRYLGSGKEVSCHHIYAECDFPQYDGTIDQVRYFIADAKTADEANTILSLIYKAINEDKNFDPKASTFEETEDFSFGKE